MKRAVLVFAVLALVACERSDDQAPAEAEAVEVRLQAHYLERIILPPGSWLQAELFDEQANQIIGQQRLEEATAPPFDVLISVAPEDWHDDGDYRLYLTLNLPDGSPRFAAELAVSPAASEPGEVRLLAVDLHEAEREALRWLSFRCGEIPVDFLVLDECGVLVLPWADLELEQVEAASGARYRGQDAEFWTRGTDQATLALPDLESQSCDRSQTLSPWSQARQRGVYFRATGNEPGWVIQIEQGAEPRVSLSLDYGSRQLEFERASWDGEERSLSADSPGNQLNLRLTETACMDSMVGWTFPYRVDMHLNDLELQACGRFLDEIPDQAP